MNTLTENEELSKRLKESYKDLPVLKGFVNEDGLIDVWCPYCQTWHTHTYTHWEFEPWDIDKYGSQRTAHCGKGSPYKEHGYLIKRITPDEITSHDNRKEQEPYWFSERFDWS